MHVCPNTPPIHSFVLFHVCAICSNLLQPRCHQNLEQTWVKKPGKFQFYSKSVLISARIVPLPCTLNYSHQLLRVALFFMHVCQGLYNMLNAYIRCYMNIHKPRRENFCDQQWHWKGRHCDQGGTCPLHPGMLFRQPLDDAWMQKTLPDEEDSHTHIQDQDLSLGAKLATSTWIWYHFWIPSGTNSKRTIPGAGKSSQHHYWQSWTSCCLASLENAEFPVEEVCYWSEGI